jgi:ABC-type nitrate/sulfonate/bicarbonate transport system ATPase subunit
MEKIDIQALTYTYSGHQPIFNAFSWQVQPGGAWAVIGPSGCGKTTLLYLLAGLYSPNSGNIHIDGSPVTGPRPRSGLVLQDHGLLPWSTVLQNARLGLTIREFYGSDGRHAPMDEELQADEADQRVLYWLEKLSILHLQHNYPAQLSRGQCQRTAIARTLATQPDLLILDEPFSALDAPTREDLQNLVIHQHKTSGLTYLIVTHDIEVAVTMGKQILVLNEGTNHHPVIVENRDACRSDYRYQTGFRKKCDDLHQILGDLI